MYESLCDPCRRSRMALFVVSKLHCGVYTPHGFPPFLWPSGAEGKLTVDYAWTPLLRATLFQAFEHFPGAGDIPRVDALPMDGLLQFAHHPRLQPLRQRRALRLCWPTLLLSGDQGASREAPWSLTRTPTRGVIEGARGQREAPAARWLWRRASGDPGTGRVRYRPMGLTSRIDEILLSFRPWSFTCR